ncbi:hypothetical protein JCM10908_004852 [Rhodotorula pacifica]|uniref:uncharacterized protein n=1 Tax=Rhodotorula pacifica TaxID=1495444 RepID=UPI00316EF06D
MTAQHPHVYGAGAAATSSGPAAASTSAATLPPPAPPHRYQLPIPPHAPALFNSTRGAPNSVGNGATTRGSASAGTSNNLASVPSMSITDAIIPGPSHIAPLQTSIAPQDARAADPESLKRARMAQHTKDLEAWVLGSGGNPAPPPPPPPLSASEQSGAAALSAIAAAVNAIEDVSDQDAEGEDDVDLDLLPAPAAKRARTSGSSTPAAAASVRGGRTSNGSSAATANPNGRSAAPARKGKAGAIARKYLMETDSPTDDGFLAPNLPPLPPPKLYNPATAAANQPSLASATPPEKAVANAGPVNSAKGKRKASGAGASSSRRTSSGGIGGGGASGGAVTNNHGASTGTALVTSIHAADGPEEPIVGPDPTPAALVALYPLQPRPARPPRVRPPRSSTGGGGGNSPGGSSSAAGTSAKGPLLSAEQKKANHIASEQKRRAAIRKGYDGLCEVVPTLKAAVEEFEERVRKVAVTGPGGAPGSSESPAPVETKIVVVEKEKGPAGKRQGRGKGGESTTGALMGGISVGGEKIDGRAGPKSEAVVLTQTVEHIRRLLADRTELLAKLSHLHSTGRNLPRTGATREWDDRWDDGMREEMGIALADVEWEDE